MKLGCRMSADGKNKRFKRSHSKSESLQVQWMPHHETHFTIDETGVSCSALFSCFSVVEVVVYCMCLKAASQLEDSTVAGC